MGGGGGGDEAAQGGAEMAGGEVVAGEEIVEVFAECFGGAGPGFFLGVVEAEMRVAAAAGSAATAAIRERKRTQGPAVLWTERGHGFSPKLSFGNTDGKSRAEARPLQQRGKKRRQDAGATAQAGGATPGPTKKKSRRGCRRCKKKKPRRGRGALLNRKKYMDSQGGSQERNCDLLLAHQDVRFY